MNYWLTKLSMWNNMISLINSSNDVWDTADTHGVTLGGNREFLEYAAWHSSGLPGIGGTEPAIPWDIENAFMTGFATRTDLRDALVDMFQFRLDNGMEAMILIGYPGVPDYSMCPFTMQTYADSLASSIYAANELAKIEDNSGGFFSNLITWISTV